MSTNEFGGLLYNTQWQMLNDIAWMWISASGMNDAADMRETLATMSDEQMAKECAPPAWMSEDDQLFWKHGWDDGQGWGDDDEEAA
jgi:hypothetical protein